MSTHIRRWGVRWVLTLAVGLTIGIAPTRVALGAGFGDDPPSLSEPQSQPCKESCGGNPHKHCSASEADELVQPDAQCGW